MSIRALVSIICDGCGQTVTAEPEHRSGYIKSALDDAKSLALAAGWISVRRGRYHPKAHYCPVCADKPQKPIPRIERQRLPTKIRLLHIRHPEF